MSPRSTCMLPTALRLMVTIAVQDAQSTMTSLYKFTRQHPAEHPQAIETSLPVLYECNGKLPLDLHARAVSLCQAVSLQTVQLLYSALEEKLAMS